MRVLLFNIWYYFLFCVATLLTVAASTPVICCVRLAKGQRAALKAARLAIVAYGKICIFLTWPFIRLRFSGYTRRPGAEVFICNHRSSSDPFLMSLFAKEIIQIVNIWPFKLPILGPVARISGYLSVRQMPFESFREKAAALLAEGVSIAAFPEGTRSRDGRSVGSFHGAILRVCQETGAPIIPVCIMGNEDKPKRGSILLQPGLVRVECLPPVTRDMYQDLSPFQLKRLIRGQIIQHLEQSEGAA
ncbi:MAG: lysophospholipid acyltransferase family protein [Lentisphaeria bacterium]|nr:lysophospholipid acyltransferase family protein [Lentisphaeria bacterium]